MGRNSHRFHPLLGKLFSQGARSYHRESGKNQSPDYYLLTVTSTSAAAAATAGRSSSRTSGARGRRRPVDAARVAAAGPGRIAAGRSVVGPGAVNGRTGRTRRTPRGVAPRTRRRPGRARAVDRTGRAGAIDGARGPGAIQCSGAAVPCDAGAVAGRWSDAGRSAGTRSREAIRIRRGIPVANASRRRRTGSRRRRGLCPGPVGSIVVYDGVDRIVVVAISPGGWAVKSGTAIVSPSTIEAAAGNAIRIGIRIGIRIETRSYERRVAESDPRPEGEAAAVVRRPVPGVVTEASVVGTAVKTV